MQVGRGVKMCREGNQVLKSHFNSPAQLCKEFVGRGLELEQFPDWWPRVRVAGSGGNHCSNAGFLSVDENCMGGNHCLNASFLSVHENRRGSVSGRRFPVDGA